MPGSFSRESQYYLWIPYGSPPLSSTLSCGSATPTYTRATKLPKLERLVRRVTCGPRIWQRNSDTPIPTLRDAGETRWTYSHVPESRNRSFLRLSTIARRATTEQNSGSEPSRRPEPAPYSADLMAVAATLMRRRHRARVEDLAMPAKKTLALSEQLARRPGKRCQDAQLFHFGFAE